MMRIEIAHDGRVLHIDEDNFNRLYLLAHGHVAHANAEALTKFLDEAPERCFTIVQYPGMESKTADYPIVIETNYDQVGVRAAILTSEDLHSLLLDSIASYEEGANLRYLHDTVPAALRALADEYETECRNALKDAS